MQLTILGSGGCEPSLKRNSPANFLKIKNKKILVDYGSGALHQLIRIKEDYKKIDMIFLTHFHPDHIAEVNSLIQALDWTPNFTRKKELGLIGPIGLREKCRRGVIKLKTSERSYEIKLQEIKKELNFDNFKVQSIKTIHSEDSIAYKFSEKNKSIVVSGDCGYDKSLIEFAKNTNLLLIECTLPNRIKSDRHLSSWQCGEIAKKSQAEKVVLTHLYESYLPQEVILPEVRSVFPEAILGEDLRSFDV